MATSLGEGKHWIQICFKNWPCIISWSWGVFCKQTNTHTHTHTQTDIYIYIYIYIYREREREREKERQCGCISLLG